MNGEESGTETYEESDYSSGSDNDMPGESGSSPERSQERRVPKLALGGATLTVPGKPQRFAVPPLGLSSSAVTAEESSASQQPASHRSPDTVSLQPDQMPARNSSNTTAAAPAQPADAVDRQDSEQHVSRANSQRRPSRQLTAPQLTIQLASEAFVIHLDAFDQPQYHHLPQLEAAKQICATRLGLRGEALTFYELREVQSVTECSASSSQLAVAVQESMFSLTAYEEMLNRNKQDRAEAQQSAAALTSLKGLVEEQNQEVSKCSMRIGELERELRGKEEYCNRLQRELAIQRDQLQRSDTRHLEGQKSLQALKAEFDNLSTIVPRRSSLASSSSPLGSGNHAPGLINVRLSHDMRSSSSLSVSEGTTQRLVDVLEKMCDERVLAKLEHLGAIHRGVKSD